MPKPSIRIEAVPTSLFAAGGDLGKFLVDHLRGRAAEGQVLAVTSKIVSLAEGRIVERGQKTKLDLIREEADWYLGPSSYGTELTIKHGLLAASAGIDESNSATGDFLLLPKDPYASAEKIGRQLRKDLGLERFGVILTDSRSAPLRRGVTGVSLGHWGLRAVRSLVGQPDMHGRPLKFTHVNVVDAIATMAVFAMGEADEGCPLALVSGAEVEFCDEGRKDEIVIEPVQDIYFPLLAPFLK